MPAAYVPPGHVGHGSQSVFTLAVHCRAVTVNLLSQVVQLLGSHEGSHLLGSKPGVVVAADVLACMQKLAKAFVTLERDHARIAAEKAAKEEADKGGAASKAGAARADADGCNGHRVAALGRSAPHAGLAVLVGRVH